MAEWQLAGYESESDPEWGIHSYYYNFYTYKV